MFGKVCKGFLCLQTRLKITQQCIRYELHATACTDFRILVRSHLFFYMIYNKEVTENSLGAVQNWMLRI
jgi:hypothetical protein